MQPIVYRGPYEYGSPQVDTDYYPQTQPPPEGSEGEETHGHH
jgi:cytochrome c oxidase subunit 1